MGIKHLTKVISNNCDAIKEIDISELKGKVIAIDASLLLYQFIIAIRSSGSDIINNVGNSVSHLYAIFIKTTKFIESGIKPIYVFDGKPPELKTNTLNNRKKIKEDATEKGDIKRSVYITKEQIDECKELLTYMGVPYIDSPGEADCQCAALAKAGIVHGISTEDMDLLAFGATRIYRNLLSCTKPTIEIDLQSVLSKLDITFEQFLDMCIMLGCDYCPTIRGIGQKKAFQFIKKYGSINELIKNESVKIPDVFPYKETIQYFTNPNGIDLHNIKFEWTKCDHNKVYTFMCDKHNFDKNKITKYLRKCQ